jgi:hypothetical protein
MKLLEVVAEKQLPIDIKAHNKLVQELNNKMQNEAIRD